MKWPFALVVAAGCAQSEVAPKIDPRVHVVPNAPMQAAPDQLVFPIAGNETLLERQPGDLLVGGNGTGFLRQVQAIVPQGDQLVVMTTPASLTDAIVQADYNSALLDDKSDLSGPSFNGVYLGFDGTEIQAGGGADLTITRGKLDFHPSLDLALKIRDHAVSRFDLVASGELDADLAFHVDGHGQTEFRYVKDLWTSPPQTFVQMVGIVPVVEVVELVVSAEVNIGSDDGIFSLDVGASGHVSVDAGARYIAGTWYSANGHELTLDRSGPTFTGTSKVHVQVLLPVELHVQFYDLAGPYVSLEPKLEVDYVPGQGLSAGWGIEGLFGGSVDLLGAGHDERLLGFEGNLFDFVCDFGKSVQECLAEN
jgi:hypothetical protein